MASNGSLATYKSYLDAHPELAWTETQTQEYLISQLGNDYVWKDKTALVYAVGNGPISLFFRCELDALNTASGPRHACGHSAHAAALMAAYQELKTKPIQGYKIYFVFQPSEEDYPSGAKFISDNFADLKKCRAGFAFHSFPSQKIGELFDVIMAAGDYFEIHITGKGTHIKNKNDLDIEDALLPAAQLVTAINTPKNKDYIINVGKFNGGETPNSIAGKAKLVGDIRSLTASAQVAAYQFLLAQIASAQQTYPNIQIEFTYSRFYPLLHNDDTILNNLQQILPITKQLTTFATEDFSLYPVPSVFLLIGTGEQVELHEENFVASTELANIIADNWLKIAANLAEIIPT